jgi:hypothetical protein
MTQITVPLTLTFNQAVTQLTVAVGGSTTTIAVPAASVTPPPPPPPGQPLVVVSNGVNHWSGNYDWQETEVDSSIGPDGQPAIKMTSQGGTGGFQPWYAQGGVNQPGATNFDTTGLTSLTLVLAPTRAGQVWASGFEGQGDVTIPGAKVVNVTDFGPAPQPNVYGTYVIPLGASGYNLPAGQKILKFMIQDQTNSAGNVFYIKSITFS